MRWSGKRPCGGALLGNSVPGEITKCQRRLRMCGEMMFAGVDSCREKFLLASERFCWRRVSECEEQLLEIGMGVRSLWGSKATECRHG